MRVLIAIVLGCTLVLGLNLAASSGTTEREAQPSYEPASPALEQAADDATDAIDAIEDLDGANGYECKYSPYCQHASQCTAYCAGGIPVCYRGCCSCAS